METPHGMEANHALLDQLLAANRRYAETFPEGSVGHAPPKKQLAVVSCMDARLTPLRFLDLEEGDAHIIRNAGGLVTEDALRSLVISHWLLGTKLALVVAHTECGLLEFTNEGLHAKLAEAGVNDPKIDFLPFRNLEDAVRSSVRRIRESPLLPDSFESHGYVLNVRTRLLTEVL
jgi:carbonic anhydrase